MSQTDALQAALAGEHAAIYAIGVAGGHLRARRFTAAQDLYTRHLVRRDRLRELVLAAGADPAAAEPAYDLPAQVADPNSAAALIRLIEQRLAAVYGDLVATAETSAIRTFAVQAVVAAAREQIIWGGVPTTFPAG
jgi:hypothetical protein